MFVHRGEGGRVTWLLRAAGWLYRLALLSYPGSVRSRYGAELRGIFEARARSHLVGQGVGRFIAYFLGAQADAIRSGIAERIRPAMRADEDRNARVSARNRMSDLLGDVRQGIRALMRTPSFTIAAVLTMALGIGANTAIFSVVRAVLLKPLPYTDPDALVLVWGEMTQRNIRNFPFSPPDLQDLREMTTTLSDAAGVVSFTQPLAGTGEPVQVNVGGVTPNLFSLLGAVPLRGRDFVESDASPVAAGVLPGDPGFANQIAILDHGLWQRRWGGDPDVVGSVIDVGGAPTEVVGVMPPDFHLHMPEVAAMLDDIDIWVALRIDYAAANRSNVYLRVIGRMLPGVTLSRAQADAQRIAGEERSRYPVKETSGYDLSVVSMHADLVAAARPVILALLGAVVFVLLIACANVANLLLVRSSGRERELAVRAAVGGSRWRLVRQVLVESTLLSAGGGVLGLAFAAAGLRLLVALQANAVPRAADATFDLPVLLYTGLAVLVSAVLFGLVPALRASRPAIASALREGGRSPGLTGNRALRNGVIIAEVALSLVLLIGAGLMVRTFVALNQVDPGYDAESVLTFNVPLPFARYPQPEQRAAFAERLNERLRSLAGVESVTASTPLPLDGQLLNGRWGLENALTDAQAFRQADYFFVLPDYFSTMRTDVIAGRTFTWAEQRDSSAVVVVDERLAAIAFPDRSPIGERILVRVTTPDPQWVEVIGVVRHQRHETLARDGRETIYFTDGYAGGFGGLTWIVRTSANPLALADAVRAEVRAIDPLLPVADLRPFSHYIGDALAEVRFALTLTGIFAIMALTLAAIGLYGVLAYTVRQRTAEIGVRIAFGARGSSILRLVVGEGLGLSAIGILLGVAGAFALTRVMSTLLVGVTPTDPLTFVGITLLFLVVAAVASFIPAWRASRVDPVSALRQE